MLMEQLYFTDRDRGRGFDPSCCGFQVAACSRGIHAAERNLLTEISKHYADVMRNRAPKEAMDLEDQIFDQGVDRAPDTLLAAFPVVWRYDHISPDRMTLVRVGYLGLTYDGRLGNFFAHALVFSSRDLADWNHNPLTLARSSLFKSDDPTQATQLEPISGQITPIENKPVPNPLNALPYSGKAEAMVSAILQMLSGGPPMVLCLPGWFEGPGLVEALLNLIPSECRWQISFCTNESDPKWKPSSEAAPPKNRKSSNHIILFCGPNSGASLLQDHDYQNNYAIFNFRDEKYSDVSSRGKYAEFVAHSLHTGHSNRLAQHHKIAGLLGCGARPETWDVILKIIPLLDPSPDMDVLTRGVDALSQLFADAKIIDAKNAAETLRLVQPHLSRLAQAGDEHSLERIAGTIAHILERVADPADEDLCDHITHLAGKALFQGRIRPASAILSAAGPFRGKVLERVILAAATDKRGEIITVARPRDALKLAELITEAIASGKENAYDPVNIFSLMELAFRNARNNGVIPKVWEQLRVPMVNAFGEKLDPDGLNRLKRLLTIIDAKSCPQGFALLAKRFLETTRPERNELVQMLMHLTQKADQSNEAGTIFNSLREAINGLAPAPEERVVIQGRVATALKGSTSRRYWFEAYLETIKTLADHGQVRRELETAFQIARDFSMIPKVWEQLRAPMVNAFGGKLYPEDLNRLKRLLTIINAKSCPQGFAWIAKRFLETTRPEGNELVQMLLHLTQKAEQSSEAGTIFKSLLETLNNLESTPEDRAVIQGRVAAELKGSTSRRYWFEAYLETIKTLADHGQVRRELETAFQIARDFSMIPKVWEQLSDPMVKPAFSGELDPDGQDRLDRLLTIIPAKSCPQGFAWIAKRLLETTRPKGDKLVQRLTDLTQKAEQSNKVVTIFKSLLETLNGLTPTPGDRAVIQGRVATALKGSTSRRYWFEAYLETIKTLADHGQVRRELETAFQIARDFSMIPKVWEQLSDPMVKPAFSGELDPDGLNRLNRLLTIIDAKSCPQGFALLAKRFLETARPKGDELVKMLTKSTQMAEQSNEAVTIFKSLLETLNNLESTPEDRAVIQGRVAAELKGSTSRRYWLEAYLETIKTLADRNQVHKELLRTEAYYVPAQEILDAIGPWKEPQSLETLGRYHHLLRRQPVLSHVCDTLLERLASQPRNEATLALANAVLDVCEGLPDDPDGLLVRLQNHVLTLTPLTALVEKDIRYLNRPAGLSPEAEKRCRILLFLHKMEVAVRQPGWSFADFPSEYPGWHRDVKSISSSERSDVVTWCLKTIGETPVSRPEEAAGLVSMLRQVGEEQPDKITDRLATIMGDHPHQEAWLKVLDIFCHQVITAPDASEIWEPILLTMIQKVDTQTLKKFRKTMQDRPETDRLKKEKQDRIVQQLFVIQAKLASDAGKGRFSWVKQLLKGRRK